MHQFVPVKIEPKIIADVGAELPVSSSACTLLAHAAANTEPDTTLATRTPQPSPDLYMPHNSLKYQMMAYSVFFHFRA